MVPKEIGNKQTKKNDRKNCNGIKQLIENQKNGQGFEATYIAKKPTK